MWSISILPVRLGIGVSGSMRGPDVAALFGAVMDAADINGRAIAEATDNTIIDLDDTEKARWMTAAQPVVDDWLVEMEALGIDGQALIDSAKALIAKHEM